MPENEEHFQDGLRIISHTSDAVLRKRVDAKMVLQKQIV